MNFKKIIRTIHLWLGLSSGLVVFVVAITGCLYAFQAEIQDLTQPFRFVTPKNEAFLPPSQLKAIALKQLPHKHLHAILYTEKDRAAQAIFYNFEPNYYDIIFLNPYNGKVLKEKNMNVDFFRFVLNGHYYLWLPPTIGQPIVATFTLIFLVMLISGIILWYPKNKAALKQRVWFRWKKGLKWKRKNYDLHNILGFYAAWIGIIFAGTGLIWGFQWFAHSVYFSLGGEKSLLYQEPVSTKTVATNQLPAIDRIWQKMLLENPTAKSVEVHIPETATSAISVNINTETGTTWKIDYRYFDQYSLKELSVNHLYGRFQADAKLADKILRMNYDIHTGAILGFWGKFLAFWVSLIIATLPISGFLIWWGRKKVVASKEKIAKEFSLEMSKNDSRQLNN